MYVEMVWINRLVERRDVLKNLEKDFVSLNIKDLNNGTSLISGDNKLISTGKKSWMAFEPKKGEDIIYFPCTEHMNWLNKRIVDAMYASNKRAFTIEDLKML